jgi:hypothetical protein
MRSWTETAACGGPPLAAVPERMYGRITLSQNKVDLIGYNAKKASGISNNHAGAWPIMNAVREEFAEGQNCKFLIIGK